MANATQSLGNSDKNALLLQILSKVEHLDTIEQDIKSVKNDLAQLTHSLEYSQSQIKDLTEKCDCVGEENKLLKVNIHALNHQNVFMNEKIIQLENYSRRENVRISGLYERDYENCENMVLKLFADIGCDILYIQRCHRVGPKVQGKVRDILARFLYYPDKMAVMRNRKLLPRGVYMNDDCSPETQRGINVLRRVWKEALNYDQNAKLSGDKLIYKGNAYSVDNVKAVDFNLEKLSTKENVDTVAFSGRFSVLSNLHPHSFIVAGQPYKSNEHYYQYNKCMEAGREDVAAQVLLSSQPEDAMAVGKKVNMTKEWTQSKGRMIMKTGARAKFSNGTLKNKLLSTGHKIIAEATRHPIWGVGMPFTAGDVLSRDCWTGSNLLGIVLKEIREELAKRVMPTTPVIWTMPHLEL
jgi:ribA/ribD-fused uncharacterized protein